MAAVNGKRSTARLLVNVFLSARPLEASKPMPIFMSEELPDLPEYSAINRAVPQMPSGMKKEEECVSRAIVG
ncbi:Glycosyltransferase 64 protein C4 [Homalodisca vitripennis]|nr:Glycosyltransferase 64 protein C4 [Homalodisca vitripennis]